MKEYKCDKCGAIITKDRALITIDYPTGINQLDLCNKCTKDVRMFIFNNADARSMGVKK